jgi:hypothetical protein
MPTQLSITLPIEPGAKTCGECPYYWPLPRICSLHRGPNGEQLYVTDTLRLPACLASERVRRGEDRPRHLVEDEEKLCR